MLRNLAYETVLLISPGNLQDPIQPPMLLAFALPHLPPPLPAVITNGLKYLQIGGVLFDDLAGLIVGVGFLVWVANWFAA